MNSCVAGAALAFLLLYLVSSFITAQGRLETVKSIKCVFPVYATGTWQKAEARAEVKPGKLCGRVRRDRHTGWRRRVGWPVRTDAHRGAVRVERAALHSRGLDLRCALRDNGVSGGNQSGKHRAVHSRHEYTAVSLPGLTSRPEQYYGECDLQP